MWRTFGWFGLPEQSLPSLCLQVGLSWGLWMGSLWEKGPHRGGGWGWSLPQLFSSNSACCRLGTPVGSVVCWESVVRSSKEGYSIVFLCFCFAGKDFCDKERVQAVLLEFHFIHFKLVKMDVLVKCYSTVCISQAYVIMRVCFGNLCYILNFLSYSVSPMSSVSNQKGIRVIVAKSETCSRPSLFEHQITTHQIRFSCVVFP